MRVLSTQLWPTKIIQRRLHIACLHFSVDEHVASIFDIISAGARETLAHRNNDGIAALDEFTAQGEETIARLRIRIAQRLA